MVETVNDSVELSSSEAKISVKKPKRVLHFSDGTLEEYSDTEDEQAAPTDEQQHDEVDTANMSWGPWLMHKALQTGNTTLGACDYVGEALASFLGITTPKYQYELEEYRRIAKEQKEEQLNAKGWLNPSDEHLENTQTVATEQPVNGPTAV